MSPESSHLPAHCALTLFKKSAAICLAVLFGQAIDYALSRWPLLGVYLEDGRIEIDNLVEAPFGLPLLERRKLLFFGDADASGPS